MSASRRNIRRAALLMPAALLLWCGGFLWFLAALPSGTPGPLPEPQRQAAPAADAVVVLTGGSRRVPVALSLLLEGRARALLVTGVNDAVDAPGFRAAMAESGIGVDARMMACCITLGYGARDTVGNVDESAVWMKMQGHHSMILVTSTYHMPRAAMEFRAAMPETRILEYPVRPAGAEFAGWWKFPAPPLLILSEYLKYQAAWLRTGLEKFLPRRILAASPGQRQYITETE